MTEEKRKNSHGYDKETEKTPRRRDNQKDGTGDPDGQVFPDLSYEAAAEMLGIARKTLYNWRHNELFKNELDKRLKDRWKDSERLAIDTMINLCRTGNYKAAAYILDSLGYEAEKKIEVKGEISNPMAELTLEELRKLAAE